MTDKVALRNRLGGIVIEKDDYVPDNLSIALCTYFSSHRERPDDDYPDTELGWGPWVIYKTNEALDLIADEVSL